VAENGGGVSKGRGEEGGGGRRRKRKKKKKTEKRKKKRKGEGTMAISGFTSDSDVGMSSGSSLASSIKVVVATKPTLVLSMPQRMKPMARTRRTVKSSFRLMRLSRAFSASLEGTY